MSALPETPSGTLIIIGGHEKKKKEPAILKCVAEIAKKGSGRLVLVTVASQDPKALADNYRESFKALELPNIEVLDIRTRDEAFDEKKIALLDDACVIFFSGGDQLRITSQVGDSLLFQRMRELYHKGTAIVGTSAGAAAMPETMLIGGPNDESPRLHDIIMAPGLGFLPMCTVDSHFAQRGRMGRLLTAVAQNPANLGLGLDEDTAIVVDKQKFMVVGSGAVYVFNGTQIAYSSLSEEAPEEVLSIYNMRLDVLSEGKAYDLKKRCPIPVKES